MRTKDAAQTLSIDQSLISKFESSARKPTKKQLIILSDILKIDYETLVIAWIKDKIYTDLGTPSYKVCKDCFATILSCCFPFKNFASTLFLLKISFQ